MPVVIQFEHERMRGSLATGDEPRLVPELPLGFEKVPSDLLGTPSDVGAAKM
jgi:hypothetical protein